MPQTRTFRAAVALALAATLMAATAAAVHGRAGRESRLIWTCLDR